MTNLARTPKSPSFQDFAKGRPREVAKIRGLKNTPAQIVLSPNHYLLEVQTSENILLQKAAPKVPGKPSYHKFGKDKIVRCLRFCKGGSKG